MSNSINVWVIPVEHLWLSLLEYRGRDIKCHYSNIQRLTLAKNIRNQGCHSIPDVFHHARVSMVSEKWVWAYIPYVVPAFLSVGWAKDRAAVFWLKSRVLWAHFHRGLWGQRHVTLSIICKGKVKVFILLLKTNPSYLQILFLTLFSLIFLFLSPKI